MEARKPIRGMLRTLAVAAAVLLALPACRCKADRYVDYLYGCLTLPDQAAQPREYWEANVAKTLEVRERMDWRIPEKLFRYFVLPVRVGSEPLDDFRTMYADSLCARVQGLSLAEAALEINHWCLSWATFDYTDGQTTSPLQTMRHGSGQCSEESVLVVAALRAAGIPARLANAMRWGHADGNHAWVEVWTGDGWHFMGACEPDPRLDQAWINEVVGQSHQIVSNVIGSYHGRERVVARTSDNTKIDILANYAPVRRSVVKVVGPDGRRVRGANVECKVFNFGEFGTSFRKRSDFLGRAVFHTGYGDVLAWASKGDRFGLALVDGETVTVTLDHVVGEAFTLDLDIVPPPYHPLPRPYSNEERDRNQARMRADDRIRLQHEKGNEAVLSGFLAAHDDDNARALLASLSTKDRGEVSREVLEDAYAHIDGSFNPLRDSPRVEQESLRPFFAELGGELSLDSREAVKAWVKENIRLEQWYNPQSLRMPPADVWRMRRADARSRDIFEVALCRAMGLEAAYGAPDPAEGIVPRGTVTAEAEGPMTPQYYHDFTLSRIEGGTANLVSVGKKSDHTRWTEIFPAELEEGYYLLTTGLRLADRSVLSRLTFFPVVAGAAASVPIVLRDPGERPYLIGGMDAGPFMGAAGRGYYLAGVLGDRDEATRKCLAQLDSVASVLDAWDRPVMLGGPAAFRLAGDTASALGRLPRFEVFDDAEDAIFGNLAANSRSQSLERPLITLCDGWGRMLYASQGYNPSLAGDLARIVPQLMPPPRAKGMWRDSEEYLNFLYAYMPQPDLAAHPLDFWLDNVDKTLEVRERMEWNIPEREFRHFVLPLRVNNEPLDDFRTRYADELCSRVQGLSLAEAALEINHWCHEMATYQPSDGRTSSPRQTIRRGVGRCGEESVLAVAALRAAGIPARQVYTPRWAHTDDNHAWVEVWTGDGWHFMGACEPEPKLDMAWFTGPVSRAMILHTKVFGDYHGDEDVIRRTPCYTEINVIRGYVPARRSVVTVVDESGRPVKGARVEFKIYNYGEYYTVAAYETDRKGRASLDMGCGDMVAWAAKDGRFGLAVIDGEAVTVQLGHSFGERFGVSLDIVPPPENPLPSGASEAEVALNAERCRREDALREARPKGNSAVIDAFFAAHDDANARALLASLSEKDRGDVTLDVLEDAYAHIDGSFNPLRDCPRVDLEPLRPYFAALAAEAGPLDTKEAVAQWIDAHIGLDTERNPQGLQMSPADVLRGRKADAHNRDIFFVALCRALGLEAELDPLTGSASVAQTGTLAVRYDGPDVPEYYYHFTLSRILSDGKTELCTVGEDSDHNPWDKVFPLTLEAGYYMLTSGRRMADGSVLSHCEFFTVSPDRETAVPLVMRQAGGSVSVLGTMDAGRFLPRTGRGYFLLAVLGDRDEPTIHCRRQLEALSPVLEEWGRPVLLEKDADGSILEMLCEGCKRSSRQRPVVTICDSFGHIVYFSQGYNTSLAEDLKRVIAQL